jgi:hypothetical protein
MHACGGCPYSKVKVKCDTKLGNLLLKDLHL